MAFGCKVDHGVGLMSFEQMLDKFLVADVSVHENVVRALMQRGKVFQISGVGQLVQIDNGITRCATGKNVAGADESGSSGHEQCSHIFPLFSNGFDFVCIAVFRVPQTDTRSDKNGQATAPRRDSSKREFPNVFRSPNTGSVVFGIRSRASYYP